MGLTPTFKQSDIHAALQQKLAAWETAVLRYLSYLGELCVNHARSVNSYQDQTGNLRNSVGYIILKYGTVVRSNFTQSAQITVTTKRGKVKATKGGKAGTAAGEELAKKLASEHPSGYVLIVVAGMNYALAVESRGLDVLASAEQLAITELPRLLRDLKLSLN